MGAQAQIMPVGSARSDSPEHVAPARIGRATTLAAGLVRMARVAECLTVGRVPRRASAAQGADMVDDQATGHPAHDASMTVAVEDAPAELGPPFAAGPARSGV